jgi:ADP-ribosylglycohydrolase
VIQDQLAGSILGQALGDALGFVVEAQPPDVAKAYVDQWLRTGRAAARRHQHFPFGQYSDDTQLSRELLRSFRESRGWNVEAFAARLAELFRDRRAVGAGRGTTTAALRLLMGVPWDRAGTPAPYAGNGSAMRAGPLGILVPDRAAMCHAAQEQSRITHLDPRCAAGAISVARAVALAASRQAIQAEAFITEIAACAECEDASVAEAIRGLATWISLEPAGAAEHVHRSGLDPAHRSPAGAGPFLRRDSERKLKRFEPRCSRQADATIYYSAYLRRSTELIRRGSHATWQDLPGRH